MRNTRNYLDVHSVVDGPTVPPTPPTSPDPVTYDVILPEGTGYTAAFVAGSSSPALAGSTVNFTVIADEGYEITLVTVNGGQTLTAVNGVYTINAIAADTTIKAEAELIPAPVTYTVTLPAGTGYTAAFVAGSSSPAVAGSVVNFTVVPAEGYGITSVTDGTNVLTAVNSVYTINAIAADTAIVVVAALI